MRESEEASSLKRHSLPSFPIPSFPAAVVIGLVIGIRFLLRRRYLRRLLPGKQQATLEERKEE